MTPRHTPEQYIGRRLKLRDLQVFVAVVECGSMAQAAKQLGVTQPAVSDIIAGLESTFGARLFDRSPRGIETTVCGDALLRRARTVLDELRQGAKDIAFLADPTTGEVRIGCPESIAAGFLPAIVETFACSYPGIALHIDLLSTPALDLPELRTRRLDLALTRLPHSAATADQDFAVEVLFDDEVIVVAGTRSRWASLRKIGLADLADARWILTPAGSLYPELLAEAFEMERLEAPRIALTTFSVHLRNHLLATNKYVAVMPRSLLEPNADKFNLKALPIKLPARNFPAAVVTLKNRTLSPTAGLFIKHLREQARYDRTRRSGK